MNEQELIENYTMEQLADMVVDLQGKIGELRTRCNKENTFKNFDNHSWGLLHIVGREDIKNWNVNITDFLPTEPIKVADMMINASKKRINCMTEKEYDKYMFEKWQLRQIAEHLLVYCNVNGEGEG